MMAVELADVENGRTRMDRGEASALLEIPAGFGRAAASGSPSTLTLWTNPAQRIVPGIVESTLSAALVAFEANRSAPQLAAYINPPLIQLRTATAQPVTPREKPLSFAALFFPGMLLFGIFGLAQSLSEDIWRERSSGTLRRARTTALTLPHIVAGKALSLALALAIYAGIGMLAAHWALGVPVRNFALALLWVVAAGVGLHLMATLLQVFSSEQRAGVVFNGFVLFLFSMIGGSLFPFELMPSWLASIGRYVPNGWATVRFKELLSAPLQPAQLAVNAAILGAFLTAMFVLLVRRLRTWA